MDNFKNSVWTHYAAFGRHDLPWRQLPANSTERFYKVLVSEIMLQQTGVPRVKDKYSQWMAAFPLLHDAATSQFAEILKLWHGLGYNRRALYLHQSLQLIFNNGIPDTLESVNKLPGVGHNTAGAIMAYTYNYPAVFIETNIRSVFIYHFFKDQLNIHDREIIPLVHEALKEQEPRQWYWALMDYGTHIKKSTPAHRKSAHYKKQSPFEGSLRQLRAQLLRSLTDGPKSITTLKTLFSDERVSAAVAALEADGLIELRQTVYRIASKVVK